MPDSLRLAVVISTVILTASMLCWILIGWFRFNVWERLFGICLSAFFLSTAANHLIRHYQGIAAIPSSLIPMGVFSFLSAIALIASMRGRNK